MFYSSILLITIFYLAVLISLEINQASHRALLLDDGRIDDHVPAMVFQVKAETFVTLQLLVEELGLDRLLVLDEVSQVLELRLFFVDFIVAFVVLDRSQMLFRNNHRHVILPVQQLVGVDVPCGERWLRIQNLNCAQLIFVEFHMLRMNLLLLIMDFVN